MKISHDLQPKVYGIHFWLKIMAFGCFCSVHMLHKTCTTVKTAFSKNVRPETSQHALYRTSTVVKSALSIFVGA